MLENSMLNNLNFDPAYIIAGLAAVCALLILLNLVNMIKIHGLKKNYKRFMEGSDAASLEKLIHEEVDSIAALKVADQKTDRNIENIDTSLKNCFQKMGVVRYDALNMAGSVSFSVALLNNNNDGLILNSVHTREGSYLFMKEIRNGKCDTSLGKEEQEALNKAMQSL